MPSVEQLKVRLSRSLKAGKVRGALAAISALTEKEPNDPTWPKRAARLLRSTDNVEARLKALRRARELQIDQGLVLDAIASCKSILEIVPEDEATLDCLDLLYLNRGPTNLPEPSVAEPIPLTPNHSESEEASTAGLDSILLRDCVPGARSVQYADAEPGRISEIPLDVTDSSVGGGSGPALDLRLDEWSEPSDLEAIRAAQSASLPRTSAGEVAGSSERGSSLREELANVPLFGDLDPASLHTLIRRVRVVQLEAGQILFRQGDPANSLYVIVEGAVVPIAEGERRRKLAVLERGEFFGEIGLMAKQPRNATIEALVETKLLAIDRRVLWELIEAAPSVAQSILRFLRARLIDRQIRTNLFFAAFAHAEREAVARQFRVLEVTEGTRIVEQGKPPEGLFVVLSGSLEVRDRELEKSLGTLSLGDVFGGLSLIQGQASPSEVVASGKCWLVVLGEARFRKILDANPRLIRVLKRLSKHGVSAGEGSGMLF